MDWTPELILAVGAGVAGTISAIKGGGYVREKMRESSNQKNRHPNPTGKMLTVDQHDRECKLKLVPLHEDILEIKTDLKELLKMQRMNGMNR